MMLGVPAGWFCHVMWDMVAKISAINLTHILSLIELDFNGPPSTNI